MPAAQEFSGARGAENPRPLVMIFRRNFSPSDVSFVFCFHGPTIAFFSASFVICPHGIVHMNRSAGLISSSGSHGRQKHDAAASKLAAMASLLPGVYGSRQSEGAGSGVTGAVVALVDPARVEVRGWLFR